MLGALVPATMEHAKSMAPNMRDAEAREVYAARGHGPEESLYFELNHSLVAWSWIIDDQVACMFGIVKPNLLDTESYPWFLTTDLVPKHARQFARACKLLLPELLLQHPRLIGRVDARYHLSIRWLEWLGAELEPARPWGIKHNLFHRFKLGA